MTDTWLPINWLSHSTVALGGFLLLLSDLIPRLMLRRLRRRRKALWVTTPPEVEACIPVFVSDDADQRRLLRMTPGREIGIVFLIGPRIVLHTVDAEGRKQLREFDRTRLKAEWIGISHFDSAELHWFALGDAGSRLLLTADTGSTADVFRNVTGQDVPPPPTQDSTFKKHGGRLAMLTVFLAVFVYGHVEIVGNPLEVAGGRFASGRSWWIPSLLVLAGGAIALATPALIRARVLARQYWNIGLMICVLAAVVGKPLLKRLDTLTASEPMREYEYVMVRAGHFEPAEDGPPLIDDDYSGEWAQVEPSSRHRFKLQHGGLGLWQVDRRSVSEAFRAYQRKRVE